MTENKEVNAVNGKKYIKEAVKNSKKFLEDAKLLIDNGSFAHGAAFAVLAIEEAVKAKVATSYIGSDGALRVDSETYEEEIKSHFRKLSQAAKDHLITAMLYEIFPEGRTASCSLKELHDRVQKLAQDKKAEEHWKELEAESYLLACLTVLKMKWLYVDAKDGEVTSPLTWKENDALEVLHMAEKRIEEYEMDLANFG
jgi:AbiV family abortive infection protein